MTNPSCPYCNRSRSELRLRGHATNCAIRRHPSGFRPSLPQPVEVVDITACPVHRTEPRYDCTACELHAEGAMGK